MKDASQQNRENDVRNIFAADEFMHKLVPPERIYDVGVKSPAYEQAHVGKRPFDPGIIYMQEGRNIYIRKRNHRPQRSHVAKNSDS